MIPNESRCADQDDMFHIHRLFVIKRQENSIVRINSKLFSVPSFSNIIDIFAP